MSSGSRARWTPRRSARNRAHAVEVRRCHVDASRRDPELEGALELTYTIGPTGQVGTTLVDQTPDDAFARCVTARARGWRFPKSPAATIVHQRFDVVYQ